MDLSVKWKLANSIGYLVGSVVDSSNTLVVVGVNGIGTPSAVQGVEATTGKLSWQVIFRPKTAAFPTTVERSTRSDHGFAFNG